MKRTRMGPSFIIKCVFVWQFNSVVLTDRSKSVFILYLLYTTFYKTQYKRLFISVFTNLIVFI